MKIIFLGTGAAEGIPALYCRCKFCTEARKRGGKNIRTRSALRIGEKYQIDLPPETFSQMIKNNIDMYSIEHLLITHSHLDHLQFEILFEKVMAKNTNKKPVNIYISSEAWEFVKGILALFEKKQSDKRIRTLWEWVRVNQVEPYRELKIGELQVKTVYGNHTAWGDNEKALNYLIKFPEGKKLLYAVDTGFYSDMNMEYLTGESIDILIMECTFGGRNDRGEFPESHLDVDSFIKMVEKMENLNIVGSQTKIYATHINPHHGLLHEELQSTFDSYLSHSFRHTITVAYDGLTLEI